VQSKGKKLIAFLILAHEDPLHVKRLVARLKPHAVYIHLDKKTNWSAEWAEIDATFIEPRVPVYWAGYSQVEATLALLRAALSAPLTYEKIVLLSGSDYPARPMRELEDHFAANPGHNFIRYVHVDRSSHLPGLIDHYYFRDGIFPWQWVVGRRSLRTAEKIVRKAMETAVRGLRHKRIKGWEPYHGSAYWALSAQCATQVLSDAYGPNGAHLRSFYKRSFASDEQFFHSLIGNSQFAELSDGEQAYLGRGTYRMANLHLVDASLAKWYGLDDISVIQNSGRYFVRKVSSTHSSSLLDELDRLHS
jgi:hypothetical protein